MMGNLFARKIQPSELKKMSWEELNFWNGWHKEMVKAEEKD